MFDAKAITQAPSKAAAKPAAKKPKISAKQAKLIADALKKHAAQKPRVHVHISTPSTFADGDAEDVLDHGIDEATEKK